MQSLIEQAKVIQVVAPATLGSGGYGTWINTKNYDKITFVMETGTVTTGGNVLVRKNSSATSSGASNHTINHFYKRTASTDTYVKTSATSSGVNVVVTSVNNLTYVVEVDTAALGANHWVTLQHPSAFASCNFAATAIAHKARYQQESPPTALT